MYMGCFWTGGLVPPLHELQAALLLNICIQYWAALALSQVSLVLQLFCCLGPAWDMAAVHQRTTHACPSHVLDGCTTAVDASWGSDVS